MKAKLTTRTLSTLEPKEKPYQIWDTEIPGFFLRIEPTGTKTYSFYYRNKEGRERRYRIGKELTPTQARDAAKVHSGDVAKGVDIVERDKRKKADAARKVTNTLSAYLDKKYGPWLIENRKSGANALGRLRNAFSGFGNRQLDSLTSWDLEVWRKKRKKGGIKDATIRNDVAELKALLQRAVEWGDIKSHPLAKYKLPKMEDNKVTRYLSDDERVRLFNALDEREDELRQKRVSANDWRKERGYELLPFIKKSVFTDHLKPMVVLALNTALRRGELFHLRWSDIDLDLNRLTVRAGNSKSGKPRTIPLNKDASKTLKKWRASQKETELVFPSSIGKPLDNIQKAWIGLIDRAKIEDFRFHDLRHDFASQLVMRGVDLYVVKELLGHSTIQVTERYSHLAPAQLEDAVERLVQ